jgi:putative addiction module component (TIGR02574 family)
MKLQEVRESALALPRRSREKLVSYLAKSLEESGPKLAQVDAENLAEAEARIVEHERGEAKTISLQDFLNHINPPAHAAKTRRAHQKRV